MPLQDTLVLLPTRGGLRAPGWFTRIDAVLWDSAKFKQKFLKNQKGFLQSARGLTPVGLAPIIYPCGKSLCNPVRRYSSLLLDIPWAMIEGLQN